MKVLTLQRLIKQRRYFRVFAVEHGIPTFFPFSPLTLSGWKGAKFSKLLKNRKSYEFKTLLLVIKII